MLQLFHLTLFSLLCQLISTQVSRTQHMHTFPLWSVMKWLVYELLVELLQPFCPVAQELMELGNIPFSSYVIWFITWPSRSLQSLTSKSILMCVCCVTVNYAWSKSLVNHMEEKQNLHKKRLPNHHNQPLSY